ncbi:MAG: hypothetical protein M3O30_06560, partial [Planctomycetota bacterium]|nr:hypothetical protein [Planctomycetota bacterium]
QQFSAVANDQFGIALSSQPGFAWSRTSGIGSISGTGLYTAPGGVRGLAVVQVAVGGISTSVTINVGLQAAGTPPPENNGGSNNGGGNKNGGGANGGGIDPGTGDMAGGGSSNGGGGSAGTGGGTGLGSWGTGSGGAPGSGTTPPADNGGDSNDDGAGDNTNTGPNQGDNGGTDKPTKQKPAAAGGPLSDSASGDSGSNKRTNSRGSSADSQKPDRSISRAPLARLVSGAASDRLLASASVEMAQATDTAYIELGDRQQLQVQSRNAANEIKEQKKQQQVVESVAASVTATAVAGYLVWLIQSGSLLMSAISTLPFWGWFDPLPVLDSWEKRKVRRVKWRWFRRRQTRPDANDEHELEGIVD